MTASQTPKQWTHHLDGREIVTGGRVGSTGLSTGPHLHGSLIGKNGEKLDWTNTEAAHNVLFQKPTGEWDRLYVKDKNGQISLNPFVAKTSGYGERVHPVTGAKKFHDGTDYGLQKGTLLGVFKDTLTGSFQPFTDSGYGNGLDIPTKYGTLRWAHLQGPANKLTIGEPASTSDSSTVAATPQPQPEPQKQNPLSTAVNIVLNIGKKKDEESENDFATAFLRQYMQNIMNPPDYTKMILQGSNPYETA